MTTLADRALALGVDRSPGEKAALCEALREPVRAEAWSGTQWQSRCLLASEERVAPLLYQCLRDEGAEPPRAVNEMLRKEYYRSAALNLVLLHELDQLVGRDSLRQSKVLVLKGGALATSLYDNPAHRPMSDLDLLVSEQDFGLWMSELSSLGYRSTVPVMAPGLEASSGFQVSMIGGPGGAVVIELHRGLVAGRDDWRAPELEWFWKHTEALVSSERQQPGSTARQMNPTAAVLYLAAHAMLQHGAVELRLIWLIDIDRLIRKRGPAIDWDTLCSTAGQFGWAGGVLVALETCRDLLATPVPEGHLATLGAAASEVDPLLRSKVSPGASRGQRIWHELGCLDWPTRFRHAFAILAPSPDYLKWRYPGLRAWWPLGYPYRWVKVAAEAVRATRSRLQSVRSKP